MDQSSQRARKPKPETQTSMPCGLPDNFPASVTIVTLDGRIAYASTKLIERLDAARPDVIGQDLGAFLSLFDGDDATAAVLADLPLWNQRAVLRPRDGTELDVSISADDWRDPDGRRYRVIDISDAAGVPQTDDDVRKRSFRLQSCLDGTNAGTWEWNVQTGDTTFSERWAEIVGYRLDELEPVSVETWKTLAHPDDLERSAAKLERHFAGQEEFYDLDSRMRHKDGRDVWIKARGRVCTWTADGKPEWMFGTHVLIDDEKVAYDTLRANHALLERVAALSGVGAWEVRINSKKIFWSDETKRIHGVPPTYEPTLEEGIDFYAPEARPIISAAVEEGMKSGTPWDLELPLIRRTGQRIWVRAVGTVEFENGEPDRIVGSFQDITTKVQDRNELVAAKEWTAYAAAKGRVGLWSLDTILGELNWDDQMTRYFGFRAETQPKTVAGWMKALNGESRCQLKDAIRNSIFSGAELDLELTVETDGGEHRFLKLVGAPHTDQENTVDRIQGACFDLTEHRQLNEKLEEQASKLSATLSSIGDGVITTDETGRVTWMNSEAEKITGQNLVDVEGRRSADVFKIVHERTGETVPCPIERCLKTRVSVQLDHDAILLRTDGTDVAIDDTVAPLVDTQNRVTGAVMVFRDSTAQRRQTREITYRASHDSLTGLLNRDSFLSRLEDCLSDPLKRNGSYLFFIDIDHFKRINDSIGHAAGDTVLAGIANVLRDSVDTTAAISRLGGDEFSILLRAKTQDQAERIGAEICGRAAASNFLKRSTDRRVTVGTSIGIVSLAKEVTTTAEALRMADIAAYSAKNNGRGQACVWNDHDGSMIAMSRQTSLISLIETAIGDESWTVQEQCIKAADATSDTGAFAELLIRLPDGKGGIIPPSDFLPAAERYGLMQDIDLWMCAHALERIRSSVEAGVSKLYAVNISASSVGSEGFKTRVMEILSTAPASIRNLLCFEVTETAVLKNYDACRSFLADLRSLGARVAIDDFGAGSTSFRHFQSLPADYLKIDGSFIQNMDNPIEAACIECFLRMAKVANFKTIAEHVENDAQIAALTRLKVDFLQGYALGRPC